ncbi:MAG: EI24 domain-containing protein [Victivallaceae bacterium]|nr:EI24 domain-containing protein [Victivallaceae bacterium]
MTAKRKKSSSGLFSAIADFLRGAAYVKSGCAEFYGDKGCWKFAILPMVMVLAVYIAMFLLLLYLPDRIAPSVDAWIAELPKWLSWIGTLFKVLWYAAGTVVFVIVLGTMTSALYETFGGLFFDPMVERHERRLLGTMPNNSFVRMTKICLGSMFFALGTLWYMLLLMLLWLFLPVVGQIVLVVCLGYRTGISYLISPASVRGITVGRLRETAADNRAAVLGFGVCSYLLFLIPFATLIVLPGVVLGGAQLFDKELDRQDH